MNQNTNYFEVVAKAGHVGLYDFYEAHFFVIAESKAAASQKVKKYARVKKNHADAILSVSVVTHAEYVLGRIREHNNPFFHCANVQEQRMVMSEIAEGIRAETPQQMEYLKKKRHLRDSDGISCDGIRNRYKYRKFNRLDDIYDEVI